MFEPNLDWHSAVQRAQIMQQIRQFFSQRNVIEVETPLLCQGTVTDKYLEAFDTKAKGTSGTPLYYLQTSPEFAMKRLLAAGYQDIFQLCKAFRDEEQGTYHNPEFTMLEWYRIDFDHFKLMNEVDELLQLTLGCKPAEKISYQEVFQRELGIDPLTASLESLKTALNQNNVLGDWISLETDKDILLQVLFTECIEKSIGLDVPCIVYHFPASQASLAKINQTDRRVANRFEAYFKGVELANGFHELSDAEEQVCRFEQDNKDRQLLGKAAKPIDAYFVAALKHGLPNCAGVALGVDRLLMLALGLNNLSDVITFSFNNA